MKSPIRRKPYLFETAGDVVRCQEDFIVSEETSGLGNHQETVVEEDELRVQVALLLPVPDNISQHTSYFKIFFILIVIKCKEVTKKESLRIHYGLEKPHPF